MIEFLSSWAKSLGVTIVIVSILEMLLPNNKTKKYIRMVLGIFVIFNIISPFITNKDKLNFNSMNIGDIGNINTYETSSDVSNNNINQVSMDERIEDLYQEELENDITKKLEEQGFKVTSCKVEAKVPNKNNFENEEETGITKIKLKVEKNNEKEVQDDEKNKNTENKLIEEIQKIKKVDTSINESENTNIDVENNNEEDNINEDESNSKVTKSDIQNIKKILIEEYGVSEKCLEIN